MNETMNAIQRLTTTLHEADQMRPRTPVVPPPRAERTDDLVAAALAGGMIAAGGKAVTAEEAVGV